MTATTESDGGRPHRDTADDTFSDGGAALDALTVGDRVRVRFNWLEDSNSSEPTHDSFDAVVADITTRDEGYGEYQRVTLDTDAVDANDAPKSGPWTLTRSGLGREADHVAYTVNTLFVWRDSDSESESSSPGVQIHSSIDRDSDDRVRVTVTASVDGDEATIPDCCEVLDDLGLTGGVPSEVEGVELVGEDRTTLDANDADLSGGRTEVVLAFDDAEAIEQARARLRETADGRRAAGVEKSAEAVERFADALPSPEAVAADAVTVTVRVLDDTTTFDPPVDDWPEWVADETADEIAAHIRDVHFPDNDDYCGTEATVEVGAVDNPLGFEITSKQALSECARCGEVSSDDPGIDFYEGFSSDGGILCIDCREAFEDWLSSGDTQEVDV